MSKTFIYGKQFTVPPDAPRIKKEGLFTFPKKLRNSWPCECVVETEPDLIAGAGTGAGEKAPAPGR